MCTVAADRSCALWRRLLGRPVSESGTFCHGDGATDGADAAGGC